MIVRKSDIFSLTPLVFSFSAAPPILSRSKINDDVVRFQRISDLPPNNPLVLGLAGRACIRVLTVHHKVNTKTATPGDEGRNALRRIGIQ